MVLFDFIRWGVLTIVCDFLLSKSVNFLFHNVSAMYLLAFLRYLFSRMLLCAFPSCKKEKGTEMHTHGAHTHLHLLSGPKKQMKYQHQQLVDTINHAIAGNKPGPYSCGSIKKASGVVVRSPWRMNGRMAERRSLGKKQRWCIHREIHIN